MAAVRVEIKNNTGAIIPSRGSALAAGYDLYATAQVHLEPMQRALVPTDLQLKIPAGYFGNIRDRSGLAAKHGLHVFAGVIDADYTGRIAVVIANLSSTPYTIESGTRVAQLIVQQHAVVDFVGVDDLSATARGESGFGSTGTH